MIKKGAVTVSINDWMALSEEDKALMRKLGICVEKEKDKNKIASDIRKSIAPDSYILAITEICKLCGEIFYKLYDMIPDNTVSGSYLRAVEIQWDSATATKKQTRYRLTCSSCETKLSLWSKSELITKLIELADIPTTKLKQRKAARDERLAAMDKKSDNGS